VASRDMTPRLKGQRSRSALTQNLVVLLTSYYGADITTTPNEWGTKRLPWQHWLPSNRATISAFYDRIYQKRKGL